MLNKSEKWQNTSGINRISRMSQDQLMSKTMDNSKKQIKGISEMAMLQKKHISLNPGDLTQISEANLNAS